jgi:hypothetical protein
MCYYRLYILLGCGHSTFSSTPVRYCANATSLEEEFTETKTTSEPTKNLKTTSTGVVSDLEAGSRPPRNSPLLPTNDTTSTVKRTVAPASRKPNLQPCEEGRVHPLHTRKVDRQCAECVHAREARLKALESMPEVVKIVRSERSQPPPAKRQCEEMILRGRAEKAPKVDSGVWAVGTKWMEGWRKSG